MGRQDVQEINRKQLVHALQLKWEGVPVDLPAAPHRSHDKELSDFHCPAEILFAMEVSEEARPSTGQLSRAFHLEETWTPLDGSARGT
jgi:hypothetical protein